MADGQPFCTRKKCKPEKKRSSRVFFYAGRGFLLPLGPAPVRRHILDFLMVRDWDVVRELLGKIEDESLKEFIEHLHKDILFGKNDEKFESIVARHLKLLSESGYIKGIQYGCTLPGKVSYVRIEPELTMAGYDLLEVLRSKTVWRSK